MDRKIWTTPELETLNVRASTEAQYPPGGHDSLSGSDHLCPNGGGGCLPQASSATPDDRLAADFDGVSSVREAAKWRPLRMIGQA